MYFSKTCDFFILFWAITHRTTFCVLSCLFSVVRSALVWSWRILTDSCVPIFVEMDFLMHNEFCVRSCFSCWTRNSNNIIIIMIIAFPHNCILEQGMSLVFESFFHFLNRKALDWSQEKGGKTNIILKGNLWRAGISFVVTLKPSRQRHLKPKHRKCNACVVVGDWAKTMRWRTRRAAGKRQYGEASESKHQVKENGNNDK